jgi:hypothetical protein
MGAEKPFLKPPPLRHQEWKIAVETVSPLFLKPLPRLPRIRMLRRTE